MNKTDLNILEAMYFGNHLNTKEIERAKYLIFSFNQYIKNSAQSAQ
jgi:hypothetical protein